MKLMGSICTVFIILLIYTASFEYLYINRELLSPEGVKIIDAYIALTPIGETLMCIGFTYFIISKSLEK